MVDYVAKTMIQSSQSNIYIYGNYFMSVLLISQGACPLYDYEPTCNYAYNIEGGLFQLEEMYVPINKDGVHQLFLRIKPQQCSIELWNSMGPKNTEGLHYMGTIQRYLYNRLFHNNRKNAPRFAKWRQTWTYTNRLANLPRQDNGDDCVIFTITSMVLLQDGALLNRSSYSQSTIALHDVRH